MNPFNSVKFAVEQCLVVAKDPYDGLWYLATREVFRGRDKAEEYAKTLSVDHMVVQAVRPIVWDIRS